MLFYTVEYVQQALSMYQKETIWCGFAFCELNRNLILLVMNKEDEC